MNDKSNRPKFAIMVWQDAWSDEGRYLAGDPYFTREVLITEIGWVMFDDDERVVICREFSDHVTHNERMFSSCISVPRGMVRELTYVEVK